MELLYNDPIYSDHNIPVCPRAYIDDLGLHVISSSLHVNTILLEATLQRTVTALADIGSISKRVDHFFSRLSGIIHA